MFGMLIYETLTGTKPFHGDTPSVAADKITKGQRPPRPPAGADAADHRAAALWALHESCTEFYPVKRPDMDTIFKRVDAVLTQ
jgi:hypothetical protein